MTQGIMLSERSQRARQTLRDITYAGESKNYNKLINITKRNKPYNENKLLAPCGENEG